MEIECNICKKIKSIENFKRRKNYTFKTCKKCTNEYDKTRKKNLRQKRLETLMVKCEKCEKEKPLKMFAILKKFYKKKICLDCYPSFLTIQKTEQRYTNTNVNYRIKKSLAARLRNVIKQKNNTTMNYIGCNIQFLKEWFEYNFTDEMNWDNYGSYWSIDHVIPCCKFDLENEEQKIKCWNWTNLTPVTVKFNCSKKEIDQQQLQSIIEKLKKFKEKGSTTKWFSEELIPFEI